MTSELRYPLPNPTSNDADDFDILGPWPADLDSVMLDLRVTLVSSPSSTILRPAVLSKYGDVGALIDFRDAIQTALEHKVQELEQLGVTTAAKYVRFMDSMLQWAPIERLDGKWIYTNLIVFYWVFNLAPLGNNPHAQTQILPQNVGEQQKPVTAWLVRYANKLGEFMCTRRSWPAGSQETFMDAEIYHLERYQGPWTTFNDFFSRHLKKPNPVDGQDDDSIIVSAADSTYSTAMLDIDIDGNINVPGGDISVKGLLWNIRELLTNHIPHHIIPHAKTIWAGGKFVHAFLNTYDYHRQHAPVSGKVIMANVIQGQCYLEVKFDPPKNGEPAHLRPVRPITLPGSQALVGIEAEDSTGYQFLQTRGVIIIHNDNLGYVAILPVGMAQVSSVKINPKVVPGYQITKGEEISWFELGGSDYIMVFQKKANVSLTVDLNPPTGTHKTQGQQVAVANY